MNKIDGIFNKSLNILNIYRTNQLKLVNIRCSSTESSANNSINEDKLGKPQMYHLEHIKQRLEFTVPRMFRTRLDFTFYRSDMVYEDRIFQQQKQ